MDRKRLTREDSRNQTARRLLDAAQKLIATKGLSAASIEDIAATAGYTRGAFYSNFDNKGDLFIELLQRANEQTSLGFLELCNDELSLDHIQQRTREIYSQLYRDNGSFMSWTEAHMLAARDTKFRARLNTLLARKRDEIAQFVAYFYRRAGVAPPVRPVAMALGLMSLVDGVKLSMFSSPEDMIADMAETVLALFADATMQMARLRAAGTETHD